MEHGFEVILTLTGGLCVALILGLVMQSLKMSPLVGYLLAGIVVGPFTPGFVADAHIAEQFAEIGIILLMFGVGLHFHLKDLMAVRTIAITGALVQIGAAVGVTLLLMGGLGWSWQASLVLGLAVSVASTVVLLRVLADNHALHTPTGHTAIGWLLVEDLFTVMVLVLMPSVFGETQGNSLAFEVGLVLIKLTALIGFSLLAGRYVIPRLLGYVAKTRSRELFTLTVLALALGIAVGSAKLFGASMALGAFLAGMVVGQSPYSARAASDALPMRDAFAVLFFVSTGMLFKPSALLEDWPLVLATLGIVLIAKPVAALAIMKLMRRPMSMALPVAIALAQIGEFSFILGALGTRLGVLPDSAMNALVSAAIVSIMINPVLYRRLPALLNRQNGSETPVQDVHVESEHKANPHKAVVVGYGPVGRTLTRLLIENGIRPTVVELNPKTITELQDQGIRVVYGDASQREILVSAGIEKAGSLFLTASVPLAEATVQHARELNQDIRVVARSSYLREIDSMQAAGAQQVFSEEGEIAMAMTGYLLWELGASADQIDRERERLRGELFRQAV